MAATCLKQYNVRCHPRAASPIAHCFRLLIVWRNSKMQPVVSLPALHSSDTCGHFCLMFMQIQAHWG